MLIKVITPRCIWCGHGGEVSVDREEFFQWRGGALIQEAMPTTPQEIREQMISGTHPECWTQIFSEKVN